MENLIIPPPRPTYMSVSSLDSEAHKYRNSSASQNEIRQFDVILLDDADILLNPSASLIILNHYFFVQTYISSPDFLHRPDVTSTPDHQRKQDNGNPEKEGLLETS